MKNIIIAALVGISFLTSGFWIGLRLAPMPKKPAPVAVAKAAPKPVDPKTAFSIESLKRASENLVGVNDALQTRERAVAARERAAAQSEDEIVAERAALDRLHAQFKTLYSEFQKRLQLVTDDETAALQRQVTIYSTMEVTQSIDLIRALDDATVTRIFVLMEDKALAKIVAAWKSKYPTEAPRLLAALNGMGRVVAKDKIRLPDGAPNTDTTMPQPPTATDVSTPAGAPAVDNAPAPANAAPPENTAAPANSPAPDNSAAAASAPATDATPASDNAPAPVSAPAPAPDATTPAAPASDATTPPVTAPANAAPSADAPAPSVPAANPSSASISGESTLPLDTPGETAAKASNTGDNNAPTPTEIIPATTPTMHLAHEKPARFASARNN